MKVKIPKWKTHVAAVGVGIITIVAPVIVMAGCSESDPVGPTDQILEGQFILSKAVGHQLMDVGGDHINNPLIIRFVPHTYYYPEGTGRLILGADGYFFMEAPMSLQPIHIAGTFEVLPAATEPYSAPERLKTNWTNLDPGSHHSYRGSCCPEDPFTWIGNTLKLNFSVTQNIDWELFWKKIPAM